MAVQGEVRRGRVTQSGKGDAPRPLSGRVSSKEIDLRQSLWRADDADKSSILKQIKQLKTERLGL